MPEQEPRSCLEFRPSPIHGFGAFAAAPIRAGRLMLEYVGEKITKTESARRCEAEYIEGQIWIVSRREIATGEELTFNYGYDWEDHHEHSCRCGAPECVGYIVSEEFFPKLRQGKL